MPSEMVERVARAMADAAGLAWDALPEKWDIVCGHGMPEGCRQYWYDLARAAIEAMREPTRGMKMAGAKAMTLETMRANANYDAVCDAWPAMIDTALSTEAEHE